MNHGTVAVQVPMLVGQSCVSSPLLGSNVITEVIKESEETDDVDISSLLKEALHVSENTVKAIVSILGAAESDEYQPYDIRVGKHGFTDSAGKICKIRCRVREWPNGRTVLYEPAIDSFCPEGLELFHALVNVPRGSSKTVKIPVQNTTKHDIFLPGRTVLCNPEEVANVRPVICPQQNEAPAQQPLKAEISSVQLSSDNKKQQVNDK